MTKNKDNMVRWLSVIIAVCVPALTFIWYLSGVNSDVDHNEKAIEANKRSITKLNTTISRGESQLAVIEERTGSIKESIKIILSDVKELRKEK